MLAAEYEIMQRAVDARRSELKRACDAMMEGVDEQQALAVTMTWKRQAAALDAAWNVTKRLTVAPSSIGTVG